MSPARIALLTAVVLSSSICLVRAQTQNSSERFEALQQRFSNVRNEAIGKLPGQLQRTLSGGAANYLHVAEAWQKIQASFGEGPDREAKLANLKAALEDGLRSAAPNVSSGPIPVSNPSTDFLLSIMGGFTQSETSTAWCGSGVVAGFNDSGSILETLLSGPGGLSSSGAGASNDFGFTFRDIGYINPGPNVLNFLGGDPVVNCTSPSAFYYSQIGGSGTASGPTSVVFLSNSTNGGFTWEDPIAAVSKSAFTHFLDKDWSAIDPKHPRNIFVAYTDFDISFTTCPQSQAERVAIEIVHSTDGGITWSEPTVVDQTCSGPPDFPFLEDPQIVVDSQGRVYVEWQFFPTGQAGRIREFRIARSTNHAASFAPFSKIDSQIATGDGFALEGLPRNGITGSLTIDGSGTKSDGSLYFAWDDGRLASRVDVESPFGFYNFANVLLTRSTDGGKTWSSPVRVNNDPLQSSSGSSRDHFQPGVAVDSIGTVAACWYDRRDAPVNYRVSRFCGISTDHGASWTNTGVDPTNWQPIHATDVFINPYYLGDYDTVVSDRLMMSAGFQGAYGKVTVSAPVPNQDVFLVQLNK